MRCYAVLCCSAMLLPRLSLAQLVLPAYLVAREMRWELCECPKFFVARLTSEKAEQTRRRDWPRGPAVKKPARQGDISGAEAEIDRARAAKYHSAAQHTQHRLPLTAFTSSQHYTHVGHRTYHGNAQEENHCRHHNRVRHRRRDGRLLVVGIPQERHQQA